LTCGHFTSTAYKLRRQIFVDHGRRKQAFDSLYQRYQKAYKKMENNHDPDLPRFLTKQEFGKGDIAMFGDYAMLPADKVLQGRTRSTASRGEKAADVDGG
jgi:hypothetical protein